MKKIISAGLAALLAASALTTAAFAEDANTIVAQGTLAKPAIKVTMPKNMAFVFNPYKLKVNAKGGIDAEAGKNDVVVGSYAFDATTAETGWQVVNGTGTDLKAAIYAYAADTDTLKVYDSTASEAKDTADTKILALTITAKGDDTATVKLQKEAPAADTTLWALAAATSPTAFKVAKFNAEKPLGITMTGAIFNKSSLEWVASDAPAVTFVFAFDFSDPTA